MKPPGAIETSPAASERLAEWERALGGAIRGKPEILRLSLVCLLSKGHLLIEDVPGVGKTTLAHAIAKSVQCEFHRLQFTSDMLPSDVIGVTIYNAHSEAFEFKPGPIFTHFLLSDEINRATPKTQSALLEAMNDGQVTVDGRSLPLPEPFMVVATQNPVEHHGTYPASRISARSFPDAASDRISGPPKRARNSAYRCSSRRHAGSTVLSAEDVLRGAGADAPGTGR